MIALCDTGIVQGSQNEIIMLLIDDKMLCEYLLNIVSIKLHVTGSDRQKDKKQIQKDRTVGDTHGGGTQV